MSASDIAALVDRRRQDRAAVFAVPHRIVGAATEKRDAKRSASDYHAFVLLAGDQLRTSRARILKFLNRAPSIVVACEKASCL